MDITSHAEDVLSALAKDRAVTDDPKIVAECLALLYPDGIGILRRAIRGIIEGDLWSAAHRPYEWLRAIDRELAGF